MRNIIERVALAIRRQPLGAATDFGDQLGGIFHGVDAGRRQRGVRGEPVKRHAQRVLALVADRDLHLRGLADEAAERLDRPGG